MRYVTSLFLLLTLSLPLIAAEPSVADLEKIQAKVQMRNGQIYGLQVNCDGYTDAEYEIIGKVTSLKSISLSGKELNDEQLKILAGLKELESILINGSQLTDEGYRGFAAFPKLAKLSIFHPSRNQETFTGKGLIHLKEVPSLTQLTFAGATAGDEALEAVGQLTQLESFREWHNTETFAGLAHLAKLTKLKSIRLGQRLPNWGKMTPASFDDQTLAILAKIASLETIELTEARLSFSGVIQLKELLNLKTLKINQVDISASDVEKLKSALPQVKIEWQPLTDDQAEMLSKKLKL